MDESFLPDKTFRKDIFRPASVGFEESKMIWTPKKKSVLFSSATVLASISMLVGGVATTGSLLEPFTAGIEWAVERPLSDHTHSLTIVASRFDDGNIRRLPGVEMTLRTATHEVVATGETGADGRAFFEVQARGYWLEVRWGNVTDTNGVNVWTDERRGLYFDTAGNVFWRHISHEQLEKDGDVATLGVRISDERLCEKSPGGGDYCAAVPPPGARVELFRVDGQKRGELVADYRIDGQRDPSRQKDEVFEPNQYFLRVTYDGAETEVRIILLCDMFPRFTYADGNLNATDADCSAREPVAVF